VEPYFIGTSGIPREKLQRFIQAMLEKVQGIIVNIKPERIVSFDYSLFSSQLVHANQFSKTRVMILNAQWNSVS